MAGGSDLGYGLPERKTCCILPLISFCILADINLQLTVFSSLLSFMYPLYMFYLSIMLFLIPTKKNLSEWRIYETPPRHLHAQFSNLFLIIFLLQNVSFFTVLFAYLLKNSGSIWFLHTLPEFSKVRNENYLLVFSRFHMAGDFFFLLMPVLPVRFLWACGSD